MFYVVDDDGFAATDEANDVVVSTTYAAAELLAKACAEAEPGKIFYIAKVVIEVKCPVLAPTVSERT